MTTNQQNYPSRYARIAHLASDSMKAFHNYIKAETDEFTAWENLPLDTVQTPLVGHFKQVDRLVDQVTVEPGYSGHKWEGKLYRQTAKLSSKELAKLIREELAIEFPGCKFSVTTDHNSINVGILEVDFDPISEKLRTYLANGGKAENFNQEVFNQNWNRSDYPYFNEQYKKFTKKVGSIREQYNYDDSDSMTDYFSVRYYGSVRDVDYLTVLADQDDPTLKAKRAEADRQQRRKEEVGRDQRRADNLARYGDHKKGDYAWYVVPYDSKYGYFQKGELLPCRILSVPNGRARLGGSFNVRLYLRASLPIMLKNKREGRLEPAFGFNIVEYQDIQVWKAAELKALDKPATSVPAKSVAARPAAPARPAPVEDVTAAEPATVTVVHNTAKNGLEVGFSAIPTEQTRNWLKGSGYRWNKLASVWYVAYSEAALAAVLRYFGVKLTAGNWSQQAPSALVAKPATVSPSTASTLPDHKSNDATGQSLKFIKTADAQQAEADKKYRELAGVNRNTPKRNREANSKQVDADMAADRARYYRAIGQAIAAGTLPASLRGISPVRSDNSLSLFVPGHESQGYYDAHRADYPPYQYQLIKNQKRELGSYSDQATKLGLRTYDQVDQAYNDLLALAGGSGVDPNKAKLAKLIDKWRFVNEKGFFPTPEALGDRVVRAADIRPGMSVLEPSAGLGDLAEAVLRAVPSAKLDVVERFISLSEILQLKGFNVVGSDFMQFGGKTYDRIVMNPPFENGQDADHIQHAYGLLNGGGRLVAIAGEGVFFRSDKKSVTFRDWLDDMGASVTELPESSFKSAFRPTGIRTRLIVMDRLVMIAATDVTLRAKALLLVLRLRLRLQ